MGKVVLAKISSSEWGSGAIEKLSKDIESEYSGITGFSPSNLYRMRSFYSEYKDNEKLASLTREISWTHNLTIIEMVKDTEQREFYIKLASAEGYSVKTLRSKITNNEFANRKQFQNNFGLTIADEQRRDALTNQFKDDINLSLLRLQDEPLERELEDAIVKNIVRFLADLGQDLLLAGRQYKLYIEDEEVRVDLMLYHRKLRCFVVVDLKVTDFKFQDAGQIGGYLEAVDQQVKAPDESPSIGLIICRSKNRTKVEYALRASSKPIGVMTYSFEELPKKFAQYLPSEKDIANSLVSIDDIEKEL